ncbi:Cell binding factor 2 precursor [hydrothermal vent metagenome]|uniref:Cell binding factor 2 n=1 Tax=hydrothermal vent metagenome TaxID=652676 RepID=A0A1W1CSF7_9ZZZZ
MKKILLIAGLATLFGTTAIMAKTAGTVNDIIITVTEANQALNLLTKGKMTWEKLPADGKKQLIQMMAPAKLVAEESKKSLTKKEKEAALAGFWMQKKMAQTKVSDEEAKAFYEKMKKAAKKAKSKQKMPVFEAAKNNIKIQMAQEKVVAQLMKSAKIKVK